MKLLGALTSLRSTNPRPWFCFGSVWFIRQNSYNESITLQNKNIPFKNTKHLFLPIFYFFFSLQSTTESKVDSLADHTQIDKRTTMKNQNRSAALGWPAMTLLRGGGGGLN